MNESSSNFRKAVLYVGDGLTELAPLTLVVPKGLLPVYDKPLVYYPLSVIMLAGIRRVALVTRPHERKLFERLLGDGAPFGMEITYFAQADQGPARSLLTATGFIAGEPVALVQGDALVCGEGLQRVLVEATSAETGATVLAHPVDDARSHTVFEVDEHGRPQSIQDRTGGARSQLAAMGISFFDGDVASMADTLARTRGDAFRTADLLRAYLAEDRLTVRTFGRGFACLDTATPEALLAATNFIETIETTHGLKIGCPEEIAYQRGWITSEALRQAAASMNNAYGQYLERIAAAGS